jgi:hypothetical protein
MGPMGTISHVTITLGREVRHRQVVKAFVLTFPATLVARRKTPTEQAVVVTTAAMKKTLDLAEKAFDRQRDSVA